MVKEVFSNGVIKLINREGKPFRVNGHRIKHYFGGDHAIEYNEKW